MNKKIERVFRERRLSPEEVAGDEEVRRKVQAEFPSAAPTAPSLPSSPPHSALDVPVASLGPVLHPLTADDDLLGEMLDDRR